MNTVGVLIVVTTTAIGLVLLGSHRTRRAGVLVVGVVVLWNAALFWRKARFARGLDRAEVGSTLSDTREWMGNPQRETDGTVSPIGGPKQRVSGCVRELRYVQFWVPSQYALCFDKSDRLVRKYHYVSY